MLNTSKSTSDAVIAVNGKLALAWAEIFFGALAIRRSSTA